VGDILKYICGAGYGLRTGTTQHGSREVDTLQRGTLKATRQTPAAMIWGAVTRIKERTGISYVREKAKTLICTGLSCAPSARLMATKPALIGDILAESHMGRIRGNTRKCSLRRAHRQ